MPTTFSQFGNGTGWLYITLPDGTSIVSNFRNDTMGREVLLEDAKSRANYTSATSLFETAITGHRYWIDTDPAAVEGVIAGTAIEISGYVIGRSLNNTNYYTAITLSAGVATITRYASETLLSVDSQGGAPTDTLNTITMAGSVIGDKLIIFGTNSGHIVTLAHGAGNIFLANGQNFSTGLFAQRITLQYNDLGGTVPGWYEISRQAIFPTVANQRIQNIALPVQGVNTTNITAGGGTVTLVPGTDKEYQRITGSAALAGSWTFAFGGTPKDGDRFIFDYRATMTIGAFNISFGGVNLTATQALNGLIMVYAYFDGANALWRIFILANGPAIDFATVTALNLRITDPGTPAADGYILSKTVAGALTWIPNQNNPVIFADVSNSGTSANTTETTLKSFSLPSNTMSVNNDRIEIEGVFTTAANVNNKTINVYFGATQIWTSTAQAFNNQTMIVRCTVDRVDNTNEAATGANLGYAGFNLAGVYSTPVETLSAPVVIALKGLNGVASANDIVCKSMVVKVVKRQ